MNEYKEALKRIKSVQAWDEGLGAFWNIFDHRDEDIKLIEELIAEKTEQLSRKDKLVVGSEWECVVGCYGDVHKWDKGDKVTITKIVNVLGYLQIDANNLIKDNVLIDQFLLCFKPIEKPNE